MRWFMRHRVLRQCSLDLSRGDAQVGHDGKRGTLSHAARCEFLDMAQAEQVQMVDNQDVWTVHLSRPRRFELKVPEWLQVGVSRAREPSEPEVGCQDLQAGVSLAEGQVDQRGWGVPRTSVRCVPRWRQAGVSLAEGQEG